QNLEGVMDTIVAALHTPTPDPSPQGGGEPLRRTGGASLTVAPVAPRSKYDLGPEAGGRGGALQAALFTYVVSLADDALVLGHRLSQWSGHAPMLEEDIALSNLALDLVGQA